MIIDIAQQIIHLITATCHNCHYAVPQFNSLEAADANLVSYNISSSEVLLATKGYMGGTPFGLLPSNGNEPTLRYHCVAINREANDSREVSFTLYGMYVDFLTMIYRALVEEERLLHHALYTLCPTTSSYLTLFCSPGCHWLLR